MKFSELLKPSWKIALIAAVVPWFVEITYLLIFPLASSSYGYVFDIIIGPIVSSIYLASSFVLKFRKALTYYLLFAIPYTIIIIFLYVFSGAIPIYALNQMQPNIQVLMILGLFTPILINMMVNPTFLLWLPQKIRARKINSYLVIGLSAAIYFLVHKYGVDLVLSLAGGLFYAHQVFNVTPILDVVYAAVHIVYAVALFEAFNRILKKHK